MNDFEIATYGDAVPIVPTNQPLAPTLEPTPVYYPDSDGFLSLPDNDSTYDEFNNYYLSSEYEREYLANIDNTDAGTALLQYEYLRTYELIKIKDGVFGIFGFIIFVCSCIFLRRLIGG